MTDINLFISAFRDELRKFGDIFHTEHVDNAITAAHKAVSGTPIVAVVPAAVTMPIMDHADEGEQEQD